MPASVFNPNDDDQAALLLEQYANQLHEHGFDSVRIFVTRKDGEGKCSGMTKGAGQWYAAAYLAREWILREEAREARRAQIEADDE